MNPNEVGQQIGYQIGQWIGNGIWYGTWLLSVGFAIAYAIRKFRRPRHTSAPVVADWAPPAGPQRS